MAALEKDYPYEIFNLGHSTPVALPRMIEILEQALDRMTAQARARFERALRGFQDRRDAHTEPDRHGVQHGDQGLGDTDGRDGIGTEPGYERNIDDREDRFHRHFEHHGDRKQPQRPADGSGREVFLVVAQRLPQEPAHAPPREPDVVQALRSGAMLRGPRPAAGYRAMPKGLLILLVFVAVVVVYTIARVISLNRLSEQQWKQVDKSKLRDWEDDEDDWD